MSAPKETTLALVTKLQVNVSDAGGYLNWLAQLMMLSVESSGALNAEIFPPSAFGMTEWVLVQRFYTLEQVEGWQKSERRRKLLEALAPDLKSKRVLFSESIDSTYATSVAVVTHVKEGEEKGYFAYERKYQSAQAQMAGYRGAYVQPPANGAAGTWITIIRFDSQQSMNHWFTSEERKKLVAESDPLVESTDFQNVTTSFPGWFPTEADAAKGPPNWKTAMLILLGLYPSVMLVIIYLLPLLHGYPLALNNFIGNIITVAFTTWVTMPLFIKLYKSWLFQDKNSSKLVNAVSLASLIVLFALEVAFFWSFY